MRTRGLGRAFALSALTGLAVTGCLGSNSETGSPNGSNPSPVVISAAAPVSASGASSVSTPFNVTLTWNLNHEAVMRTASGHYWIQIEYSTGNSGPRSLATAANGALPSGMSNPFLVTYGMAGASPTTGVTCTINSTPSCTIAGLPLYAPTAYAFYIQACAGSACGTAPQTTFSSVSQASLWPNSPPWVQE